MKNTALVPVLLLFLLLFFPSLSVRGACNGLLLWFNVVLPTLAPFIICTQMITALGGTELLMIPFYPLLKKLFGLSVSGSYVLLCGLLCGYPLGAKMCADFKRRNVIAPDEAEYLLAICNHPSPMFLLGYVRAQLPFPVSPGILLTCLYLPILPLSLAAGYRYRSRDLSASSPRTDFRSESTTKKPSLEEAITTTCETMVIIGGYIMIFSILAAWIQELSVVPAALRAVLTGMMEITTGVNLLCTVLPASRTFLPVICTVAFGGFCGIFQTRSVIRNTGLSLGRYVGWKAAHACLSGLTAVLLGHLLP